MSAPVREVLVSTEGTCELDVLLTTTGDDDTVERSAQRVECMLGVGAVVEDGEPVESVVIITVPGGSDGWSMTVLVPIIDLDAMLAADMKEDQE